MGAVDAYRITDKLDDSTPDVLAARLEARGQHPRFIGMMREYLGAIGKADFFAPGLQALARLLPKSGAMSESEARALVDALMKQSDAGTYFGASNFYSYVAMRA
jgi:hypothetical protein